MVNIKKKPVSLNGNAEEIKVELPAWLENIFNNKSFVDLLNKKWFLPMVCVVVLLTIALTMPGVKSGAENLIFNTKSPTDISSPSLGKDPAKGPLPVVGETPTTTTPPPTGDFDAFRNPEPTTAPFQQEDSLDQRVTTNEWYPVGLTNSVTFKPYGNTVITIGVADKTGYSVRVEQSNSKIYQNNQELQVQLRYKNTVTDQIVYGKRAGQFANGVGIGEYWPDILGNIDPKIVQWQPIFSLRSIDVPKITKSNLQ